MQIQIRGLAHYLPDRIVTNDELAASLGVSADWIARTTGVLERRRVQEETTSTMAAAAIRRAALAAQLPLEQTDLVIGACAGRQQTIPCTAAFVHEELQLPTQRGFAFDVDVTCLGFLNALVVSGALLSQGMYQQAAIFSSEIASGTIDPDQPESAVLFGDAAAAAMVTMTPPGESSRLIASRFRTISEGVRLAEIQGGGTLHHPNHPSTHPRMNLFQMRGPEIFKLATRHMETFLDQFFDELPWRREEIDVLVPHQASRMALRQLTRRYGFREEQLVQNLDLRGNCVAASLPLLLSESAHCGRIRRGNKLLLVGTGAGLTLGAVAIIY